MLWGVKKIIFFHKFQTYFILYLLCGGIHVYMSVSG